MPPKNKYSKEEIVEAALRLTVERGIDAVTARDVGGMFGTSSKPVYTAFSNMSELKTEVLKAANLRYEAFVRQWSAGSQYPAYKAIGMAYICFAKEERELFKLLFMRDRRGEEWQDPAERNFASAVAVVKDYVGLSQEDAMRFHLEMWIFVHGIATMIATSYLEWDGDTVSQMLTDEYNGLRARFLTEPPKKESELIEKDH